MGIFSSKTTISLASSVWNLGGDIDLRPDLFKTLIVSKAIRGNVSDGLIQDLLSGPATDQKRFLNWAKREATELLPTSSIEGITTLNGSTIAQNIPHNANENVVVQTSFLERGNFVYIAEKWLSENNISALNTNWTADYNGSTNQIIIQYEDTTKDFIPDDNFDKDKLYLIAYYYLVDTSVDPNVSSSIKIIVHDLSLNTVPAWNVYRSTSSNVTGDYFPFIPLRLNNTAADLNSNSDADPNDYPPSLFTLSTKAYKKGTGADIQALLDQIEDNESIDDIDHIFMVYGVSLNTKDKSAKKYIYEYFKYMQSITQTSLADYNAFYSGVVNYELAVYNYVLWVFAQNDPNNPLYQTPEPYVPPISGPKYTTLRINSPSVSQFDMRVSWIAIDEEFFIDRIDEGAYSWNNYESSDDDPIVFKKGKTDIWESELSPTGSSGDNKLYETNKIETLYIYKKTDSGYSRITVKGLIHQNFVYKGRSVNISMIDALEDTEESGFIIPLHRPTLKKLNIIDQNQLTTANTYLVFNSYQSVTQKWYERNVFKVILAIAFVAVVAFINPVAAASAGGVLGVNTTVGIALGLSGTAAIVVGAVANAIAAMIIVNLVTRASIEVFGDKIGAVVAAIASYVAISVTSSYMSSGQFGMDWGSMMRAENIMNLTNVGSNAYSNWMNAETSEIYDDMQDAREKYEIEQDKIDSLLNNLPGNDIQFNVLDLTDALNYVDESSGEFISRTTMTGTDIVRISHNMIYNYVDIMLTLPESGE